VPEYWVKLDADLRELDARRRVEIGWAAASWAHRDDLKVIRAIIVRLEHQRIRTLTVRQIKNHWIVAWKRKPMALRSRA
jgi:hypothetical protein